MAVDIRATVTCSLGTVISGNISDSYIQGKGLITVQGQVEISGLITPAVGTAVTFAYKRNGGTRNIPRKLRVLSSFADPFRRTTKVQLGCKLAYLADLREKLKWTAFDDPENLIDYDPSDYDVIPIPVRASSMMDRCLTELNITASSNPLTSKFSTGQYDFSAGWVNVLNDLLISEGYCGYLDRSEVLQVFSLQQNGGTGPLVTNNEIIDITAINAGQLPGEAVVVSYTAQKFKAEPELVDWTKSSTSQAGSVTLSYKDPNNQSQQSITYSVLDAMTETTDFQEITKASTEEKINVVRYRKKERYESSAKAIGQAIVQFLQAGSSVGSVQLRTITEEWFYYDNEARQVRSVRETYASQAYGYGQASIPMVIESVNAGIVTRQFVSIPYGSTYFKEGEEVETYWEGSLSKVITRRYGNWLATISGQQAVAEGRESFTSASQVSNYMNRILSGKFLIDVDVRTEKNTSSVQQVPSGNSYLNQSYAKDGDRGTSKSELVLALGSATAQRRVEFTLPLAPTDIIIKDGGSYKVVPNNAYEKAKAFGITQNRLLLGNRAGMNVQLDAVQMPGAPFSPLFVQAGGLTAMYRTNGTNWSFSAEGLVVSTEALFWGAVGGSGAFWFPVAPGVTSLPGAPATTTVNITGTSDGGATVTIGTQAQMTNTGVVKPYNETVVLAPTTRTRLVVSSFPYSLTPVVTSAALTSRTKLAVTALYPKSAALTTRTKLEVSAPPKRVSGTAAPVLGASQVSPTSTATNAGWTLVYNSTADEAKLAIDLPFDVTVETRAHAVIYVTSNSYAVFANNNVVYDNLGAAKPSGDKFHIGADDFSYQRIYTKSESSVFRIRWEGNSDYAAAAGSSNRFWELNIWQPIGGVQLVEIRSGNISGGTSGPFMLANSTTALATGTFAANESWVFEGNSDGSTWTLYSGAHVE